MTDNARFIPVDPAAPVRHGATYLIVPRAVRQSGKVARAVIEDLDEDDLRALVERLTPRLPAVHEDGWLDSKRAADYLGITKNALDKYAARSEIDFEQDCPRGKRWFRRSGLDRFRHGGVTQALGHSELGRDCGGPKAGAEGAREGL